MNDEPNSLNSGQEQENNNLSQQQTRISDVANRIRNTGSNIHSKATNVKNFGQKTYNGARKLGSAAKKTANAAKKAANYTIRTLKNVGKAIFKAASAAIKFLAANPVVLLIILGVILAVSIILILANKLNIELSVDNTHNSTEAIIKSWGSDNLSEQQKNAKESYEKSGSLLSFTMSDINKMVDEAKEKKKETSKGSDQNTVYEYMLSNVGKNDVSEINRIASVDDKVSLYEHMMLVAKYDFNNVKWHHYGHGFNGEDSPLKEDKELGIKYPSDQENTKVNTFTSLLRPYLLSYEVPMAFFSGLVDNRKKNQDVNLVYSIIKYGLSDITVNRYDVQQYDLATFYKDYTSTTKRAKFRVEFTQTSNGTSVNISQISTPTTVGDKKQVNTRKNDKGQEDVMLEEVIPDKTSTSIKNTYYISKAQIFDESIKNEYKYTPYSESDANNRINADSEVYEDVPYHEVINEIASKGSTGYTTNSNMSPEDIKNKILNDYNGKLVANTDRINGFEFEADFEIRDGMTHYVTRNWSDKLSSTKSESGFYTVDDLIEYNENNKMGAISKEDFEKEKESVEYYNDLQKNKLLNRIDFINSNPNIFKEYVDGKPYRKYVGISRNYFSELCYTTLKDLWQDLVIKYKTFPYVYGKTYGFGNSTGSSQNLLSGIDLLRLYIQSFEGDGAYMGGGRFDENHNKVTGLDKEGKTKYYKVYDAGDGKKTVGYGVNIDAQGAKFAELGIDPSTIHQHDYVESAIVDKVENMIIKEFLDLVTTAINGSLELEEYQIHALVDHRYVAGNIDGFVDAYNKYWKKESDDKYKTLFEKYKDSEETALPSVQAEVDFNHGLYDKWFRYYDGSEDGKGRFPGWIPRKESEFTLFQTGYYTTLKRFWRNSEGTPGGIVLTNGDTIDLKACLDLQNWFEDNLFSGKIPKADPDPYKFSYIKAGDDFVDTYGYLNKDYSNLYRPVYYYQCPWWSYFRGALYFNLVGRDDLAAVLKNGGRTGCGLEAATKASEYLGLTLNTSIDGIKPYSIISFGSSGDGHTAFVEAVTSTSIVLSQCSGRRGELNEWNGITIYNKNDLGRLGGFRNSVCLADAL